MFTTKSLVFFLLTTALSQASDPHSAPCLSLVSSISSCSAKDSGFYATVTDEKAALATASACLCTSADRFDTGIKACEAYAKTSSKALGSALGANVNAEVVDEYIGFCDHGGSVSTTASHGPAHTSSPHAARTGGVEPTKPSNSTSMAGPTPVAFTGAGNSYDGSLAAAVLSGLLAFFY